MFDKFLAYIKEEKLAISGQKILLAVSGGMDSMVMVDLFLKGGFPIGIGHINHHLRGEESDGDQDFVEQYCQQHQIPFYNLHIDTQIFSQGNMHNIARKIRYDWLYEIAIQYQYESIATAHHQDDNIESFFMHLMRGAGLDGLDGIDNIQDKIIRPLMFASKEDIQKYVTYNKITYREDSSNATEKYLRNHIRHQILPKLFDVDIRAKSGFLHSIDNLNRSNALLQYLVSQYTAPFISYTGEVMQVYLKPIVDTGCGASLLYEVLKKFGFNFYQCKDILIPSHISGKKFYTSQYECIIHRNSILVRAIQNGEPDFHIEVHSLPVEFSFRGFIYMIEYMPTPIRLPLDKQALWLDAACIQFPITIRKRKDGDVFRPLGLQGRSQKIKDFLINRKVSGFMKEEILLLEDSNGIQAVLMHEIADVSKINEKSTFCIKITKTRG